ncbi:hypothetical protein GCM10023262_05820 [Bartonella pachyuromydis]|uniref:Phage protein n=1 Tax=Bartonella pachyuromydis TaxID=931097 RepID=A0ABP8VED3_9HYPH
MRLKELMKIKCGKAHFEALETDVAYNQMPVSSWHDYKRGVRAELAAEAGSITAQRVNDANAHVLSTTVAAQ